MSHVFYMLQPLKGNILARNRNLPPAKSQRTYLFAPNRKHSVDVCSKSTKNQQQCP